MFSSRNTKSLSGQKDRTVKEIKEIKEVSKETIKACKDLVKTHNDIAEGTALAGEMTVKIRYDYKRGLSYQTTAVQSACAWTLLHYAMQVSGFQAKNIEAMLVAVMAMSADERKTMRDTTSKKVEEIMKNVGAMCEKTVAGMQTFDTLECEIVED